MTKGLPRSLARSTLGEELDALDGLTATTDELNILDGATLSTAELNTLDGVTSTAAELNILDGVTATADEINNAADLSVAQRAVTATSDGLTTGLLTVADFGRFLTITAASANDIVMLPAAGAAYIGGKIEMWVGANGFELRANGTAATINGVDCKTTNEAAVPATHRVRATLVAAETWLLEGDTELGARVTIVPDAV